MRGGTLGLRSQCATTKCGLGLRVNPRRDLPQPSQMSVSRQWLAPRPRLLLARFARSPLLGPFFRVRAGYM